jgi:hypothetical protein
MQSTKHLLLLLTVLAFDAMNAVDPVDEANGQRCRGLDGTTREKCNACCALLSLESNNERRYKIADVWHNHNRRCVCMRTMEIVYLSPAKIREYTALLGDKAPSAAAKAA